MSDSFDDSDPGELDPERLARLQDLLLEAAPPPATAGEWDDTLVQVFASDDAGLNDLDSGGLVPDQHLWTDDAELPGWGDDADSDVSDDGGSARGRVECRRLAARPRGHRRRAGRP